MTLADVIPINSHPLRAYDALLPKSAVMALRTLGGFQPGMPTKYALSRTKHDEHGWCTEVWLYCGGGFGFNLSVHLDVWPKRFTDAREWIAEIETEYGLKLEKR